MNPDQNPQYSIDYLNQIAPQSQKPGLSNRLLAIIAIGGGVLALIVGFFILLQGAGGPKQDMHRLTARIQTLHTVAEDAQKNIKSGELRSTNSNLSIFLTNADRDIAEPLMNNDVDVKRLDKNIVLEENGEELMKTLEDARLNAVFDRTYAREMNYQLETIAALMKKIYKQTNSKSLKEFLEKTDANLQPIKKQLAEFNAANG